MAKHFDKWFMHEFQIIDDGSCPRICERESLLIQADIKNGIFNTRIRFKTIDGRIVARYSKFSILMFTFKEQIEFDAYPGSIGIIKSRTLTLTLSIGENIYSISDRIFKGTSSLIFNGKQVGEIRLVTFKNERTECLLSCESVDLSLIFSIILLTSQIANRGGL